MSWTPMEASPKLDIATHLVFAVSVILVGLALTCILA